jgi:outer membrane protein
MRRFALIPAIPALLAIAAPAFALPGVDVGVRGYYWFPDLTAKVQTFTPPVTGTKFDAKEDLGVKDEEFPSGEAFVRFGRLHLRVGYTPVSYDGSKALTRTIVFDGQTFPVGDNVVSALDVTMLDGDIQIDLLRPNVIAANFNLGLIVKVKYVDGTVELKGAGASETKDFKAPIPMAGLAAGAGVLKNVLRADARVTGIAYSGNHLYEGDVFASFAPFPFFRIQGGYRYVDLKVDEDDIVAELKMKGPYAGAQVSF